MSSKICVVIGAGPAGLTSAYKLHVLLNPEKMPKILDTVLTLRDSSGDSLQISVIAIQSISARLKAVAAKWLFRHCHLYVQSHAGQRDIGFPQARFWLNGKAAEYPMLVGHYCICIGPRYRTETIWQQRQQLS